MDLPPPAFLLPVLAALLGAVQTPGADDANARKAERLAQIADALAKGSATYFGDAPLARAQEMVARLPPTATPAQVMTARAALGDQLLAVGDVENAVKSYEAALAAQARAPELKGRLPLQRKLSLAWMRVGERRNCVTHHNADSCIFPLKGGAVHVDPEGSRKAAALLEEVLKVERADYGSMWLLNVARMTLGDWPDAVPPQWRIRSPSFEPVAGWPRFVDIAPELKLNAFNRAGGAVMDDMNGDGRLDIVTSSMDPRIRLHLYEQQPDRTFREVAEARGLGGQVGGLHFIHLDANNDGRLDLLVQRGAWLFGDGEIPNSLLIQQPDGTFLDTTAAAGIEIAAPSQVAAAADIDNDGDLDLFLGYEGGPDAAGYRYPSKLFRNRGDGTFDDVTAAAGMAHPGFVKGAAFGDYDNDDRVDLYVSSLTGPNSLYHNLGDGKFEEVALQLGVSDPIESFACFWFDANNDGWLDLYVANYAQVDRNAAVACYYRNGATSNDTHRLYENDRRGGFRDVTRRRGLDIVCYPMGCNFGDLDNDGHPDLYLGTGDPLFQSIWPNLMLHNRGGERFEDVTAASGTGHLQKGHAVAFGDWDEDGDQDLFEQMGGALRDDAFWNVLYRNPGFKNRWLTVRLAGTASNRFGVGARIQVRIAEPAGERDVFHWVGGNSSFGGNSLQAELGLGQATRIVRVAVHWPRTGKTQTFTDVPLDRIVTVREDADALLVQPPAAQ